MKSVLLLALVSILTASCGSHARYDNVRERMLPNGDWEIALYSTSTCLDKLGKTGVSPYRDMFNRAVATAETEDQCDAIASKMIKEKAADLCANVAFKLYSCSLKGFSGSYGEYNTPSLVGTCYNKCAK